MRKECTFEIVMEKGENRGRKKDEKGRSPGEREGYLKGGGTCCNLQKAVGRGGTPIIDRNFRKGGRKIGKGGPMLTTERECIDSYTDGGGGS